MWIEYPKWFGDRTLKSTECAYVNVIFLPFVIVKALYDAHVTIV